MSTLYVNNIEPVSGSSLTLISASLVSVDNLSVVSLTSSFQGNLQGTASFATTASFALNSTLPSGVSGAIQFSDGSAFASDAANLFWDDTNNRLGIGTNVPGADLEIVRNNFNLPIFSVKTPGSANLFNVRNVNSNVAPTWAIGSSGFTTNLLFNATLLFQVSNSVIATMTNTEVQIGTIMGARLGVKGSGTTSATTALLVQNSAGTELFKIQDDRRAFFSGITQFSNNVQFLGAQDTNSALNIRFVVPGATKSFLINSDYSNTNESSAMLEVQSTTKGFLPPRMTTTQKNAIATPAAGLMVYDTTLNQMSYYNGSSWVNF